MTDGMFAVYCAHLDNPSPPVLLPTHLYRWGIDRLGVCWGCMDIPVKLRCRDLPTLGESSCSLVD